MRPRSILPNLTLNKKLKFKFKFETIFSVTAFVSILELRMSLENISNFKLSTKSKRHGVDYTAANNIQKNAYRKLVSSSRGTRATPGRGMLAFTIYIYIRTPLHKSDIKLTLRFIILY